MGRNRMALGQVLILVGMMILLVTSSALCADPQPAKKKPVEVSQAASRATDLPGPKELDKLKADVEKAVKDASKDDPDPTWAGKGHHECNRCRHFCMERFEHHHARQRCIHHHCGHYCR